MSEIGTVFKKIALASIGEEAYIAEENNNVEKRAFLFPGQGAQYVGMGKEIYNEYEEAKKIYDKAEEISEMPIKKICFEGPEEELNRTENTQMSIFVTSLAMLEVLKNKGIQAKIAVGLRIKNENRCICGINWDQCLYFEIL